MGKHWGMMMAYVPVAKTNEIALGSGKSVQVNERRIAIFHVAGAFYALDDSCPYRGAPIFNGMLSDTDVTCAWHGAAFALATGNGISGPCGQGLTSYPVRVNGEDIELDL